LYWSNW